MINTRVSYKAVNLKSNCDILYNSDLQELKNEIYNKIEKILNDASMREENKNYWYAHYNFVKYVKIIELTEEVE